MKAERCQHRFWADIGNYDLTPEQANRSYHRSRRCKNKTHWSLPPGIFEHLEWFCFRHRPGLSEANQVRRKEMALHHQKL